MRKRLPTPGFAAAFAASLFLVSGFAMAEEDAQAVQDEQIRQIPVQVLILPKFEVDELTGDFPGEAQLFYEEYLAGGDVYEVRGCPDTNTLYYKDGIAMCLAGQGKVAAALNLSGVLSDERFDFSDAYILSVGCAGSAEGYGIFGDVFVISAAVDYDLGHKADPRDLESSSQTTWYHVDDFDQTAAIRMDPELTGRVFELVKDVHLETTRLTERHLDAEYPDEEWAQRPPQVLRGTSVTGDNYWKGSYDHQNALLITETYGCPDPFAATEMEDVAVGLTAKQFGLLDRLIVLRVGVDMDDFAADVSPESLWGAEEQENLAAEESTESVDVFATAMQNCFVTGKTVIEAIREGKL